MTYILKTRVFKSLCLASVLVLSACGHTPLDRGTMKAEITEMLATQDAAWNAGDIEGFMEDYWKSEDLRFASGGKVNRGWQATLENYKTRYPDKDAMGALSFRDLEIKILSREYAQVFGRWELIRATDKPGGLFTLLVQNIDGKWVVVSDHTSSNEVPS